MKELKFTYNWNQKLDCNAFTTIRIKQPEKYKIGDEYKIILQPVKVPIVKGIAKIKDIRYFKLSQLNNFMAYIDTGYSLEQTSKIIESMYGKNNNVADLEFSIILLVYNHDNKKI